MGSKHLNKYEKYIEFFKSKGNKIITRKTLKEFDQKIFDKAIKLESKYKLDSFPKCAWAVLNKVSVPMCYCGKEVEMFTFEKGPRKYCSQSCLQNSEEHKINLKTIKNGKSKKELQKSLDKRKSTCLKRYGGDAPACSKKVRTKMENTNLKLYGVKNAASNPDIYKKVIETNLEKYGGSPNATKKVRRKYKKTCMNRYGVEHASKSSRWRDSYKETCLERYGETHYMKNPEQYEKFSKSIRANFKYKIGGKSFYVRGYEHFALNYLYSKHGIKNIVNKVSKGLPTFRYNDNKIYYPDFYNKKTDEVIEVKSDYTAGRYHRNLFKTLKAKAKSVVEDGKVFKLLVFDKDGNLILKTKRIHKIKYTEFNSMFKTI